MEKAIIVDVADNWAIGKNNDLLWHLPDDLKYFKKVTLGSPVIMGYMTFKSLGSKPLPKRENIVISVFPWADAPEDITVVRSLDEAYKAAGDSEKCFVIGGGYTYREAMNSVDKLYITHVHTTIEDADTFFPEIDMKVWRVESKSETHTDEGTGYTFDFFVYVRK